MAILGIIGWIGNIVCLIITVIKMFKDQENGGVLHGVIGIICGIWAYIWGWMHGGADHKKIMLIWTACIVLQLLGGFLAAA